MARLGAMWSPFPASVVTRPSPLCLCLPLSVLYKGSFCGIKGLIQDGLPSSFLPSLHLQRLFQISHILRFQVDIFWVTQFYPIQWPHIFLFRPRHFAIDNAKLDRNQSSILAWALPWIRGLVPRSSLGNHPPSLLGGAAPGCGLGRRSAKIACFLTMTSECFWYPLTNIHLFLD